MEPLRLFPGDPLWLAIVFFVVAIVAVVVGTRGAAAVTTAVAKWFVDLFLVLAVAAFPL